MEPMRNQRYPYIAVITVLFLGLAFSAGCFPKILQKKRVDVTRPGAVKPGTGQPTGTEQEMLREAELAHRQDKKEEAVDKYRKFLTAYPGSERADTALASLGQLEEGLGQTDQAISDYQSLLKRHPRSRFAGEVSHRLAKLLVDQGRYEEASALIEDMLKKEKSPVKQSRLRILLGTADLGRGQRTKALDMFVRAHNETSDRTDKEKAHQGVKATVDLMKPDELPRASAKYGRDYPGGIIAYVLAYRLLEGGRKDEALFQLDFFSENFPNHELSRDAAVLRRAVDGQGPPPALKFARDFGLKPETEGPEEPPGEEGPLPDYQTMDVACILPLSETSLSKYGKRVLKGLELAFKAYQAQTPGFKSNLVVLDSKGNPDEAARLVDQVSKRSNVLAVVGPLLSKTATTAATRAEELSVPMITITQKTGIPDIGPNIFRLFLTPKAQARAVAMYSIQVLGLRRMGVLFPEDAYGKAMRDYFKTAVEEYGGQVVNMVGYDPKTREFSKQVEQLAGVGKAIRRVGAGRKVKTDLEAIFIPDSYRAVAMIAPQFAYHDIMTVRMLGTSLWYTPRLLSTVARYTQKCVIPTGFYSGMERPEVQAFLQVFRADAGDQTAEPSQFEAYGFDAGLLLLSLMDRSHVSSREELVKALANMTPFPGVTARFHFDGNGEYQSEPALITVNGTEFQPVGAAEE